MTEYSTIPNPEISRPFAMHLIFIGNFFSSRFKNYILLEEHEQVDPLSNMTETELTMPMKFDDTNFFILFPKPTVSAKIIRSMT